MEGKVRFLKVTWDSSVFHGEPNPRYRVFKKISDVFSSGEIFVFGEIHPFSICRPQFGVHMEGNNVYHIPGNQHGQVSNFAFADGHAESHRWANSKFNDPKLPENDGRWHNGHTSPHPTATPAEIRTDVQWLREHTTDLR